MDDTTFEYTYSARRREEVERIRSAYLPKAEDKLEELRRLHAIPTQKAQAISLTAGILGALILGIGMSLCMTELGAALGSLSTVLGIVIGLAGITASAFAWPVYRRILKREREKIAPRILRLSEELMHIK